MRRPRAILFAGLRRPGGARPLAWALTLAFVLQSVLVGPLALAMAARTAAQATLAASMCGSPGSPLPPFGGGAPHEAIDHAHCLVCQGGVGPLFAAAPAEPPRPAAWPQPAPEATVAAAVQPSAVAAYWSRGPPSVG